MSDLSKVLAEWQSAETSGFEVAELKAVAAAEDGMTEVTLLVKERDDDATCNEDDTADEQCNDDDTTTDSEGTRENTDTSEDDGEDGSGRATWTVNGREFGYNELCTAVSEAEVPYPDDTSGDNLAETLQRAATLENQEKQTDETDTSNESDTNDENEWPDAEYLRNNGVEEKYVETVREHAANGCSQCQEEGCAFAANGEDADYCINHPDGDSSGDNDGESTPEGSAPADDVEKVSELYDISITTAEAVVFRVSKGDFDSHREAVETLA
jgi:hypothetical protein